MNSPWSGSRMREICTSGLMSGEWKRSGLLTATAPLLDSTQSTRKSQLRYPQWSFRLLWHSATPRRAFTAASAHASQILRAFVRLVCFVLRNSRLPSPPVKHNTRTGFCLWDACERSPRKNITISQTSRDVNEQQRHLLMRLAGTYRGVYPNEPCMRLCGWYAGGKLLPLK